MQCAVGDIVNLTDYTADQLFDKLARGEVKNDPFNAERFDDLVRKAMKIFPGSEARPEDMPQRISIRFLEAALQAAGDQDRSGMRHFCRGVRLGVNRKLPRVPAVYARKRKWRLAEQAEAEQHYGATTEGAWRENYKSVRVHSSLIEEQLAEHATRNLALRLKERAARARFPNLTVVSMGAVAKVPEPREAKDLRLVKDGTHGVSLNSRTKPRDQDRGPIASDVKRVQREQGRTARGRGLAVDVQEAHRLSPVHPDDWEHQG